MTRHKTLIAEDEPLAREGLAAWVRQLPQLDLVAQCADGTAALHAIRELQPSLVLMDIHMPGMTGLQVLRELDIDLRGRVELGGEHVQRAGEALARLREAVGQPDRFRLRDREALLGQAAVKGGDAEAERFACSGAGKLKLVEADLDRSSAEELADG